MILLTLIPGGSSYLLVDISIYLSISLPAHLHNYLQYAIGYRCHTPSNIKHAIISFYLFIHNVYYPTNNHIDFP